MTTSTSVTLAPAQLPVTAVGVDVGPMRQDLVHYGTRLLERGRLTEALAAFEAAASRPQADPQVRRLLNQVHRRLVPRWHFAMLNDTGRNAAYRRALSTIDLRGKTVLDVGSGSGLLAMMAADLGAAQVYSCEAVEAIAGLARRIVAVNRKAHIVEVIARQSFDLVVGRDLHAPADVLVTETIDCGLVGEGLLPIVRHAREHLLRESASIVPCKATLHAALLESAEVHGNNFAFVADVYDVTLFNEFSTYDYFPVRLDTWNHRLLSEPVDLFRFDFETDPLDPETVEVDLEAGSTGTVHGVVMWFTVELVPGVSIANAPTGRASHWMQAVQCFEHPMPVSAGQLVRLQATHELTSVHVQIV
ncbi:MAG TPA: 50S ribosomal protein L11 methyltransferase [Acidimicrobiales bacterium]|jgi:type II protein arginine methyltransferase